MKVGCVICGPDVAYGPLALLSGTFAEKVSRAARSAMTVSNSWCATRQASIGSGQAYTQRRGTAVPQVVTGELFGADGLCLVTPDPDLYRRALARTQA